MSDTYIVNVGPQTSTSGTEDGGSSTSTPSSGGITSENAGLLQQVMDGAWADGEFDENDLAAMNAILGTPSADTSSPTSGTSSTEEEEEDEMTDAEFLSAVNDIANQSDPGMGPGEEMMLDEANRLIENGGTSEDKQAFVDEATKLLNNEDGNGDGPQDIDQTNDKEGTMLHDLTTALLADNEATDDTGGSDDAGGTEGGAADANALISDFIDKAYADNTLSDTELQGLQALLGATAASDPSNTSTTDDTQTASSSYTYDDLVTQMIMGDMEQDGINNVSGNLALSYVTEEEGEDA